MEWTPEHIKELRKHVGWTQAQLGDYLGYGTGATVRISELENGKKSVSGPVGRLLDMLAEKHEYEPDEGSE